jgi:hypothetical protein
LYGKQGLKPVKTLEGINNSPSIHRKQFTANSPPSSSGTGNSLLIVPKIKSRKIHHRASFSHFEKVLNIAFQKAY